jgi:hypothetical protein
LAGNLLLVSAWRIYGLAPPKTPARQEASMIATVYQVHLFFPARKCSLLIVVGGAKKSL